MRSTRVKLLMSLVPVALATGALANAAPAMAQTGGAAAPGPVAAPSGPPGKAQLTKKGIAIPPANAPAAVVNAITAGNQIRKLPYRYGGGHASFFDSAYDCSGAVSFLLYGAGMLSSPLPSGSLARGWGTLGKGRWITVYANGGHAYMVVAGLRFDTSAVGENLNQGSG
ncbi:MAG: hypothetical protein M3M99_00870, partial [Actinomycetota bacterium]|nr:hypothetical protein [Actinomycetota bacterium]